MKHEFKNWNESSLTDPSLKSCWRAHRATTTRQKHRNATFDVRTIRHDNATTHNHEHKHKDKDSDNDNDGEECSREAGYRWRACMLWTDGHSSGAGPLCYQTLHTSTSIHPHSVLLQLILSCRCAVSISSIIQQQCNARWSCCCCSLCGMAMMDAMQF